MTKPVTIPNTFATATTAIPLSQLDGDFTAVATAINDANTYSNYAADTGSANAYVVTFSGVSTSYSAGLRIQFKAGNANTGASTINVNAQGAKNITYQDASALASGTIAVNSIVDVMYDGTQFLLMNDPAGATGGDVTGPASATDNAVVRFDGTTGKLVQNSVVTIADSTGDVAGVGALTASGNLTLSGGTANGVLYLNGSKVATSGSALTFDGTSFGVSGPIKLTATSTAPSSNNEFIAYSTNGYTYLSGGTNGLIVNNNSGADTRIRLEDANNIQFEVSSSEQMRLTSTGLGVGTSSPSAKLDVQAGATSDAVSIRSTLNTNGAAVGGVALFGNNSSGTSVAYSGIYGNIDSNTAGSHGGGMRFYTATSGSFTEKMRLDSSGNLGLGVTPATGQIFELKGYGGARRAGATASDFCGWLLYDNTGATIYGAVQYSPGNNAVEFGSNQAIPAVIYTNNTERVRITSVGNFSLGGTADRATTVGTNALNIFNGTAPVGTLANGISIYSSSGEAYVMDAAGNATLFSPHDAETNEWVFKSKHTPTGKVLKIDVEKLLRFVNDHFGLDAVHEFVES